MVTETQSSESRWPPVVVLGCIGLVYTLTCARHLAGADHGEFVILSHAGGVAHPPGYPLYTLYLQGMSWLPGATAVHVTSLATVLLGIGALILVYRAARLWGAGRDASLAATALFGVSTEPWLVHTHAEAFAANNLIAAGILLLAAPQTPIRGRSRIASLAVVGGLGIAHHHSIVLLAPVGLWGVWRGIQESKGSIAAHLAIGVSIFAAVGLLPYLLLFPAAECSDCLVWGEFRTFDDLTRHFLRADYGTTSLGIGAERRPLAHLAAFVTEVGFDYAYLPALAGVAGMGIACTRRDDDARAGRIALILSFILAGPVFVMLFNGEPSGIRLEIVRRFYAMPELILSVFIAIALDRLLRRLPARRVLLLTAPLLFAAVLLLQGYNVVESSYGETIDRYVEHSLQSAEQDAILVGTGDIAYYGFEYARVVGGRSDVAYIDGLLLAYGWYRKRLERRLDITLPTPTPNRSGGVDIDIVAVVHALQETGRPVYATKPFTTDLNAIPSYPIGTLIRLLPPGSRPPPIDEVVKRNARLYGTFELPSEVPSFYFNGWAEDVFRRYAENWKAIATAAERLGRPDLSDQAEEYVRELQTR